MKPILAPCVVIGLSLAGCTTATTRPDTGQTPERSAVASLRTAAGANVGTVQAIEADGGIALRINATGMPAGVHGVHVHTTGKCDAPDFTTAGGHWNPTARQHGSMNPAGPHAGDLPNLTIDAGGSGTLSFTLAGGDFDGLLDADGAAFIVHAGPDDLKTDPSGNSGGRIACGVFAAQ